MIGGTGKWDWSVCELCDRKCLSGLKHSKHTVCHACIDKVIEFAITAEMRFENESTSL